LAKERAKKEGFSAGPLPTPPVVVVLVDDGDGARVQVEAQEVGPHAHAALQGVAPRHALQLLVHAAAAATAHRRRFSRCC